MTLTSPTPPGPSTSAPIFARATYASAPTTCSAPIRVKSEYMSDRQADACILLEQVLEDARKALLAERIERF